jgi:hypothetical protein
LAIYYSKFDVEKGYAFYKSYDQLMEGNALPVALEQEVQLMLGVASNDQTILLRRGEFEEAERVYHRIANGPGMPRIKGYACNNAAISKFMRVKADPNEAAVLIADAKQLLRKSVEYLERTLPSPRLGRRHRDPRRPRLLARAAAEHRALPQRLREHQQQEREEQVARPEFQGPRAEQPRLHPPADEPVGGRAPRPEQVRSSSP